MMRKLYSGKNVLGETTDERDLGQCVCTYLLYFGSLEEII